MRSKAYHPQSSVLQKQTHLANQLQKKPKKYKELSTCQQRLLSVPCGKMATKRSSQGTRMPLSDVQEATIIRSATKADLHNMNMEDFDKGCQDFTIAHRTQSEIAQREHILASLTLS